MEPVGDMLRLKAYLEFLGVLGRDEGREEGALMHVAWETFSVESILCGVPGLGRAMAGLGNRLVEEWCCDFMCGGEH